MSRKLILASAVSLALLPGAAAALGLGAIRSQSALNEPFSAEIDLLDVQPDELDSVKVLLATPSDFDKAGAPRPHFLTRLRFQPQVSPQGRAVIAVTSPDPVREPFLDFLVEVNWPKGRMVKGFTVLLDPPVTFRSSPPPVERPRIGSVQPTRSDVPPEARVRPTDVASPAAIPPGAEDGPYPIRYGPVANGMGLWRAARELTPPGATVSQTAMALYRSNQHAFIRKDINKLKAKELLEIPSATELFALSPADADRQFQAALRGEAVTETPIAPAADRLEIATAPSAPEAAQAAVVPATPSAGPSPDLGALQQELLLVREEGESTRQETEELHARIRELEARLADIQRLLTLRNEQLAQIQGMQLRAPVVSPAEATDVPPAAAPQGEPQEVAVAEPLTELSQPLVSVDDGDAAAEGGRPDAGGEPPASLDGLETGAAGQPELEIAATETEDAGRLDPPAEPETGDTAMAQPPAAEALARVQQVASEGPGPEEGDLSWMALTDSPVGMAGAIAVLTALLAMVVVQRRRRLQESFKGGDLMPEMAVPAAVAEPAVTGSNASHPQRGQPAPASPMSTQISVMGDLGDETEEADVVSEADVYIAYGRYREAETLLEQELERTPGRLDLKFKLAEAYFGARNLLALKRLSAQMREDGSDRVSKDQWERLETMLQDLEGGAETRGRRGESSASGRSRLELVGAPAKVLPDTAVASVRAHSREAGANSIGLELDVDELELVAAAPPAASANDRNAATKDLELELEELERFSAMRFDEAGGSGKKAPADRPASDSLDILSMGGDSLASEVLSSKWQTDSQLWDEVATKLDLARAYMEMEDSDAARVILAEVAQEGNPDQQAEAKEMLARLD